MALKERGEEWKEYDEEGIFNDYLTENVLKNMTAPSAG